MVGADFLVTEAVAQVTRGPRTRRVVRPRAGDPASSSFRTLGRRLVVDRGLPGRSFARPDGAGFYGARLRELGARCVSTTSWPEWPTGSPTCCRQAAPLSCTGTCGGATCCSGPTQGVADRPSVHGGHPEEDLAMLALFGPVPDRLLRADTEARPWTRAGRTVSPCSSSTPCSCTPRCSAPATAPGRRRWPAVSPDGSPVRRRRPRYVGSRTTSRRRRRDEEGLRRRERASIWRSRPPGHPVTVTVAVATLLAWSGSGLRDRPAAQTQPCPRSPGPEADREGGGGARGQRAEEPHAGIAEPQASGRGGQPPEPVREADAGRDEPRRGRPRVGDRERAAGHRPVRAPSPGTRAPPRCPRRGTSCPGTPSRRTGPPWHSRRCWWRPPSR